MTIETVKRISADDVARLDAHAEHAALEYSLEPNEAPEHEWLDWEAENARWVAIPVEEAFPAPAEAIARGTVPRLRSIIEVRVWLSVCGHAHVQIHRSVDCDADGNDCEPYFPDDNDVTTARARKLGEYAVRLDLEEPGLQGDLTMVKDLAAALTRAAAIIARYESEWQRHYKAFGAERS